MREPIEGMADAMRSGAIVRICRDQFPDGSGELLGVLVDHSDVLALVHVVENTLRLEGFEVICLDDVTEIDLEFRREFCSIVAARSRVASEAIPKPDLSSFRALLEWTEGCDLLVGFHRELTEPHTFEVGRLRMCTGDTIVVDCIDPWGDAIQPAQVWSLDEITGISFGSYYLSVLQEIAS